MRLPCQKDLLIIHDYEQVHSEQILEYLVRESKQLDIYEKNEEQVHKYCKEQYKISIKISNG